MNSLRENILKYLSFWFVFLIPLVFWSQGMYPHISSKTFFAYAGIEIIFAVWVYIILVDARYRLSKKSLLFLLPVFAYTAWMVLASMFAVNPTLSFWSSLGRGTGLLTLLHVTVLCVVIASLVKRYGIPYVHSLFQWIVAGGFFLALSIWFGSEGLYWSFKALSMDNGGGLSGNSSLAATYMLFIFAIQIFLLTVKNLSRIKKLLIVLSIVVIFTSPLFINIYGAFVGRGILGAARGAMLALIAGMSAFGLFYMFLSQKKILKRISISLIAVGLISFCVLWSNLVTPGTIIHEKFAENARGSRFIFWDVAQKAMNERPFFGYGPENFMIAFQRYFDPQILTSANSMEGWSDKAHNIFYDLGVSGGYPLILLYALVIGSLFYSLYLLHKNETLSRLHTALFAGLFVAYIANNLFTFDSVLSLLIFHICIGIFVGLHSSQDKKNNGFILKGEYTQLVAFVLVAALIPSLIFFVYRPVMKSKLYAETFVMPIDKRPLAYQEFLKGSRVGEQWDAGGLAYDIFKKYSANPLQFKNDPKILPYIQRDIASITNYLEEQTKRNPFDYRALITKATFYNMTIYFANMAYDPVFMDRILETLNQAKELAPTNPNIYWNLAQAQVWKGDLVTAEKAYKDAIAIDPTFIASHRLLIQFAQVVGNKKLYEESLAQAQRDIPGFNLSNR